MIWDDPVFLTAETEADDLLTLTADMIVRAAEMDPPLTRDLALEGAAPPALAQAAAVTGKPWRGLVIAGGLHVIVLVMALGLIHFHMPRPAPQGIPISLMVVQAGAQSGMDKGTARPREAVKSVHMDPARPRVEPKLPPDPPVKQPDLSTAKASPLAAEPAAPTETAVLPPGAAVVKAAPPNAGVTRPARAISTLNVYYSLFSREAGQQGNVGLEVWVLANGQPGSVIVIRSSGYAALDNVARNAVLGLRFQPALKNGVPVTSVLPYVFRFELQQ